MTCHGCNKDRPGARLTVNGESYCCVCAPTAQDMALELDRVDSELTDEETRMIRAFDESPEARRLAWCLVPEVFNGRRYS
jgi:hypothetical protein